MSCTDPRLVDPTDLGDLLAHLHAAADEIQLVASGFAHVSRDTEAEASLTLVAAALDGIFAKVTARLEILEHELARRGV